MQEHSFDLRPCTSHVRYDILFAFPGQTLVLADNNTSHAFAAPALPCASNFLQKLDEAWAREAALSPCRDAQVSPEAGCRKRPSAEVDAVLPFSGGWFIYLGYELAGQIEARLTLAATRASLPIAFATRIPAAVIVDHHAQCTFLVAEDAVLLDSMAHDLAHLTAEPPSEVAATISALQEDDPARFLDGVRRVKEYIVAGDVFQVNLSRAYRATLTPDTSYVQLYQSLRKHNPAPFAGVALYEVSAILSSSPERLVRVQGDVIEVRPIAGTRPRGVGDEDVALSQALLAHPKERAEHVMLIDLERNDLGRICVPGSVQVDELMVLESYAHVHHIVSNVRGIKRPDVTPGQVICAVFPGGTITGCPKVRCMEIIAELEQTARGPYTGAMGYLNHNGNMDLNILIRTILVENGSAQFRVGAGIVADSVPDAELQETRAKARGLLLALGSDIGEGG